MSGVFYFSYFMYKETVRYVSLSEAIRIELAAKVASYVLAMEASPDVDKEKVGLLFQQVCEQELSKPEMGGHVYVTRVKGRIENAMRNSGSLNASEMQFVCEVVDCFEDDLKAQNDLQAERGSDRGFVL